VARLCSRRGRQHARLVAQIQVLLSNCLVYRRDIGLHGIEIFVPQVWREILDAHRSNAVVRCAVETPHDALSVQAESVVAIEDHAPASAGHLAQWESNAWQEPMLRTHGFFGFCPGLGWVDYDPTNGKQANVEFITPGWGREFADVSPLRGVVLGAGTQKLNRV
jgi:hypothetical protein